MRGSVLEGGIALRGRQPLIPDNDGDWSSLAAAIREAAGQLSTHWTTLRVALPNPLVHAGALTVHERPRTRREAEALVGWRASKLTGSAKPYRTAVQYRRAGAGSFLVYGIAIEEALCRAIEEACATVPGALTVVDAMATYRWNGLPAEVKGTTGALVDMLDDYWTLMVWGESDCPLLVKSRWRTAAGDLEREAEHVAREVFRLLAAGTQETEGLRIERCYLMADPGEMQALHGALVRTVPLPIDVLNGNPNRQEAGRINALSSPTGLMAAEIACAR